VDILKPVAKKAMRAENQPARYLIESDLDSAEAGDLATRLHHVLRLLWECYGGRNRSQSVHQPGSAIDIAAANLTEAQLSILTTLIDEGPVRMSDLSALRRVRAPTISGIIVRLLELDLVTRWRDSSDQRVVHVDITARGRTVQHKAAAARKQRVADSLTRLNRRDREALRRALPILELIAQTTRCGQVRESPGTRTQTARGRQLGHGVSGEGTLSRQRGGDSAICCG
jgi:DNA-binding MarR family transcriptional regulator